MSEPTMGEITRRLADLQRQLDKKVERAVYEERLARMQGEILDTEKWSEKHDEGHTWLWRLLAATALTALVTLLTFLLQAVGA